MKLLNQSKPSQSTRNDFIMTPQVDVDQLNEKRNIKTV